MPVLTTRRSEVRAATVRERPRRSTSTTYTLVSKLHTPFEAGQEENSTPDCYSVPLDCDKLVRRMWRPDVGSLFLLAKQFLEVRPRMESLQVWIFLHVVEILVAFAERVFQSRHSTNRVVLRDVIAIWAP